MKSVVMQSGLLMVLCLSMAASTAAEKNDLTICVHPYSSSSVLYRAFSPLAKYLSEKIGQPFSVHIAADYQAHIKTVGTDKRGIGYMGPASYVKLVSDYGPKRILGRQAIKGKPSFQGKIIARKDSSINNLADLAGKRFAFGDPNSTMSHLVPRYMLIEAGLGVEDLADYKFLGNHVNVALGVLSGDFDAGAVKEAVFYKYEQRGLKAIATTPALSEHLFVVSDKLSDELTNQIRDALLHAHESEQGLRALHAIKPSISAFVPAVDSDYDNLRSILSTLRRHGVIQ
ncbi:MAG: phosphate/phosphite/phosphonate ABC transporter substrate-binding protein [Gammaproteobacteria bacterium]|nr:phosphate/phosphite/phosphonate ABC transporter substrate-binding protein [Gammaproteobacteria bacterium]